MPICFITWKSESPNVERCPSCRARLNESPLCPRCGCDLTLVLRAERQAQNLLRQGIQAWAAGNPDLAASSVEASLALRHNPLAAMLAVKRGKLCRELFNRPDDIEVQRNDLITELEPQLQQPIQEDTLSIIEWELK